MNHDDEAAIVWRRLSRAQRQRLTFRYTTAPFRDLFELGLFDIHGKRTDLGRRVAEVGSDRGARP
jgi:hypothetical protein